ncbi:MAG TPA: ABC transporter substrate-binding protein [Thermotogota bacterium]|jgi:iron(III) transport system substrate-binding protein|nr:ABC transporter substrate-binding protein [Thermotogota bacterium]NLH19383.1 ABC transporter substrate-binding protein [Thermotogaceae bacterium]OQC31952.1 MAG: putative binding protein component of ABC iron transporter precursor [Thermotogota bacterium ADurb.Bin062]HNW47036.1 ABC transporter substrate-binding protein [Thermotogota bacterium]HNY81767.1 ABC transporter substrate-binding protein [Thermotogota bacterium]
MKRLTTIALCLLLTALVFSANSVKAYTTFEEPLAKEVFDAFEKETGIRVEWVRLSTGEAVARLEAERENPQASIWVGGVGVLHVQAKMKGLTASYKSPQFLSIPEQYRDPEGFWVGLYVGPLAFVTNKNRAKELGISAPTNWDEIASETYRGMVRMADPITSGTSYNVITTIRYLYEGDEERTFEYLKRLDKNVNMYTRSGSAPGKECAIGETTVAIGYLHDLVRLVKNGAPLEITLPSDGTGFEIAAMSLVKGGKDPVEAKKLYNWVLGPAAQGIIAAWYVIPLSPEAPTDDIYIQIQDIKTVEQDLVWDAENRDRLTARWKAEIGR